MKTNITGLLFLQPQLQLSKGKKTWGWASNSLRQNVTKPQLITVVTDHLFLLVQVMKYKDHPTQHTNGQMMTSVGRFECAAAQ